MGTMNTTSKHVGHKHGHIHGRPHVTKLVNEEVSQLAPYADLILTISLVIYFLVRYYMFEGYLLPRFYGKLYFNLNDNQRRGFINHHVAATAKIIMILSASYPFFTVIASSATLHTPYMHSKYVTLGDGTLSLCAILTSKILTCW
jgi:hypothetical protein